MKNVYTWRQAIQESDLSSTTRLVLFNLSVHMNERGENCYPSTSTQARCTGLSERAVCSHLQIAEKKGFIKKIQHGYGDQRWKRHEYYLIFPAEFTLAKDTEPHDTKAQEALNFVHKDTEPHDTKALNDVQSNNTTNNPKNRSLKNNTKRSEKLSLVLWEEKQGCRLNNSMLKSWAQEKGFAPALLPALIDEFRERVQAGGNVYADFVAAFQMWLRKGWLSQSIEQLQQRSLKETQQVLFYEKGVSL